jgi:hypothetical protein
MYESLDEGGFIQADGIEQWKVAWLGSSECMATEEIWMHGWSTSSS